jgi:alanyl-tRNA synthetase
VINKYIRTNMDFKLLDAFGFKSTLYPGHIFCQGIGFANFPEFFGKFSTTRKIYREMKELRASLMAHITGSRHSVKFDYAPALMKLINYHMKLGDRDDLESVLEIYENYGLTPELVKEHLVEIIYNPDKIDFMANVDRKSKTNMTKMYNAKYKETFVAKKKKQREADPEMSNFFSITIISGG